MSTIPESIRTTLMKALARVPQRVLLKYEDEMDDKPTNMMTKHWFPQRDILCKYLYNNIIHNIIIASTQIAKVININVLVVPGKW